MPGSGRVSLVIAHGFGRAEGRTPTCVQEATFVVLARLQITSDPTCVAMALFVFCLLVVGFGAGKRQRDKAFALTCCVGTKNTSWKVGKKNATWGTISNLAQYDCIKFTVAETLWTVRSSPNGMHTIQNHQTKKIKSFSGHGVCARAPRSEP